MLSVEKMCNVHVPKYFLVLAFCLGKLAPRICIQILKVLTYAFEEIPSSLMLKLLTCKLRALGFPVFPGLKKEREPYAFIIMDCFTTISIKFLAGWVYKSVSVLYRS